MTKVVLIFMIMEPAGVRRYISAYCIFLKSPCFLMRFDASVGEPTLT